MNKYCTFIPKKGKATFQKLKTNFGRRKAAITYNKATSDQFKQDFKDSLILDDEGVPTYESLIQLPIVRNFIGEEAILDSEHKDFPHVENTLKNVAVLINKAHELNTQDNNYIAIVDYDENNKLTIKAKPKTKQYIEQARAQYNIQKLNETAADILSTAGVTITNLSQVEVAAGRVGITNFNHAYNLAGQFTSLIQVANNLEGAQAISEEFSHLIVGIYRNTPLVQRSINYLKNEENVREVLKGQYNEVSEYYNGDTDLIAEEAAGHILREILLSKINKVNTDHQKELNEKSLFKRMVDYIVNMFKKINPAYYQDSIDRVNKDFSKIADDIFQNKRTITRKDIVSTRRAAIFNALSERGKAQVEILKQIEERSFKLAALQQNLEDKTEDRTAKQSARIIAEKISKSIKSNLRDEETISAIAAYLGIATDNIDQLFKNLQNLDTLSSKDKFITLINSLYSLQAYAPTINELYSITTKEYFEDEGIAKQKFMALDVENSLEEYENNGTIDFVDTSEMTTEEISERIQEDSKDWTLSSDETHYINVKDGRKSMRVTSVISADKEGTSFDSDSPCSIPSTNIGTGVDELFRDVLSGRVIQNDDGSFTVNGKSLDMVYPNATKKDLEKLCREALEFKQREESKGITLIPRNIIASGTINTVDGNDIVHTINVAGTLDLLGYDKDGNWYIYDMKTYHRNISDSKKAKYERQVTLYKQFLEEKYGIKIKSLNIIPIKVSYPNPIGTTGGTTSYTVSPTKPEDYQGLHGNQLLANGEEFRGASPKLQETIQVEERESDIQYKKLANDPTNGVGHGRSTVMEALNTINESYKQFNEEFWERALPEFVTFLKPFVGENIKIVDEKGKVQTVPISKIIQESKGDVTLMQRWFTSMADNPDALLQVFDYVVKKAKDLHRTKTIEMSQKILALGKKYESLGINNYDWMYEGNKQRYINKVFNMSAYMKAKQEHFKMLDEKYGQFPVVGSEEYKAKRAAQILWIKENTIADPEDKYSSIPDPSKYPSIWESLSQTQQDFYNEWMEIKSQLDNIIGPNKTFLTNSIKIRKSGIERLKGIFTDEAITNFVEKVKAATMRSFDDDTSYKEAKGIRGFSGEEIMKLPLYYVHSTDEEAKDVSTDAIGTLMAYAEMAYNYEAMNNVVNPLEIGRAIAIKKRKINSNRGGKKLMESFSFAGRTIKNPIYEEVEGSNFRKLLDDFFESKIYGRYLKDAGTIGNTNIDKNKAAGILLKLGSTVQLGFNLLANTASVATGIAMQNIEAAAGEHFNARELAKADEEFVKAMGTYVGDIGQRVNKSKLALFDQMFDVRQNFKSKLTESSFLNKTIITRIFGPRLQYIGQDAGDHWVYNRTAIAVALRYKLQDKDGNPISLWEALEAVPVDPNNPEYGNKLVLKDGVTKQDGSAFTSRDISDVSGKMRYINQHLFGIYNEEDTIGARRVILGRFLMQYRDFIPAQFRYRFGAKTTNLEKGDMVEGYYRTTGRFLKGLYKEVIMGEKKLGQVIESLEDFEKANIKRAVFEVFQWLVICGLTSLLGGADKDRPWAERMLGYYFVRLRTETGAQVPFSMGKEMITLAKSPFAATNIISDLVALGELLNPYSYTQTLKSGDYKGHSRAYRAFMESPLTLYYKTLKRISHPERAEQFYNQ